MYTRLPNNHSTHMIEMAKEEGAYMLLTQLPVLYIILRAGAGVDAGVGRAYGVRDFYFSRYFQGLLERGVMG